VPAGTSPSAAAAAASGLSAPAEADDKPSERRTLMDVIIEVVANCSEEYDDNVHLQMMKVLLMAVTSQYCQVHEASLLLAVRACFHVHLITKSQVNRTTAKAALTQMLSVVFQRMENLDARTKAEAEATLAAFNRIEEDDAEALEVSSTAAAESSSVPCGSCMYPDTFVALGFVSGGLVAQTAVGLSEGDVNNPTSQAAAHAFPSILHKDAFLLFRALCKLSMKGLHDDAGAQQDPIALQNKILSLELILHILQRGGPAFKSGDKFVYAIKQYLSVSLLANCTSSIAQVTSLSLQIFLALMGSFKEHLKGELEIFVGSIFLKILESEYSTFEHKSRVLEVLLNICQDPVTLVELFINYDCDFEGNDLFRRIVDGFAKMAKNPVLPRSSVDFMVSKKTQAEERQLRMMSLEGIVSVLKSMLRSTSFGMLGEVPASSGGAAKEELNEDENQQISMDDSVLRSRDDPGKPRDGQDIVQSYDRKLRTLEEIESGILKFNLSPKKGLAYLVSKGHLEMNPKNVAKFLRDHQNKLDKTTVGEYLGKEPQYEDGFCIKVLHEYVDSMDFTNMHFDEAIRLFLSGFRIPGESQKIDRMMEKFAERYYLQNRSTFASADMAFILAFSTIMLQTNLHNPAIRDDKRMTKEQFIKQNKGISSDGELSDEMLVDIYDRIAATPISLDQDDKEKKRLAKKEEASSFLAFSDKRRKDAYNDERKEMVKNVETLLKKNKRSKRGSSVFVKAAGNDLNCVRPMFVAAWAPIISVFSQFFEFSDDEEIVTICLEGFEFAIRLAGRLDVVTGRETFINALWKFTALDSVKELKWKNILAIQILIRVAVNEGDFLFESWAQVLNAFSQISRLLAIASGGQADSVFFADGFNLRGKNSSTADQISKFFAAPTRAEAVKVIDDVNAQVLLQHIDPVLIDRIFLDSQSLSSESVQHFVRNLCAVSVLEISPSIGQLRGKNSGEEFVPRVFSLQKIVEVADCNMQCRPRIAWTNMWSVLANHFTTIGLHENLALAMYAIDSLKQLSIKFLQKVELSNFNFQRLFLKPFEVIMAKSKSNEIKELVLRCLDIMIQACAPNIRSGWRSIFSIFSLAASCDNRELSKIAFDITERLSNQHFSLLIFDFVELMNCLVSFVAGPHTDLSLAALAHLSQCADHVARGVVQPLAESDVADSLPRGSDTSGDDDISSQVFRLWWPLLLGLSTRSSDHRVDVRNSALTTLHKVLKEHGSLFSKQTWEVVFKGVLFPIIDSAKTDETVQPQSLWPTHNPKRSRSSSSWIDTTAEETLFVCVSLFHEFRRRGGLTNSLLGDMLNMLEGCINQDVETLSLLGLQSFSDLILGYGTNFEEDAVRDMICDHLCNCMLKNLCLDFGECGIIELDSNASPEVRRVLYDCPVAQRRRFRDSSQEIGNDLTTPFGMGNVVRILGPEDKLGVASRRVINLAWGAVLYSREKYAVRIMKTRSTSDASVKSFSAPPSGSKDQSWSSLGTSAMTSMVLMLDFINKMANIINVQFSAWSIDNFSRMMRSLQATYYHARCFNKDVDLRTKLWRKGFMIFKDNPRRLPHLLEQETSALLQMSRIALRLYASTNEVPADLGPARSDFAEPLVLRYAHVISFDSIETI
jgi:brefeldin A-inhibited guanine nucleotide-exchange protein